MQTTCIRLCLNAGMMQKTTTVHTRLGW